MLTLGWTDGVTMIPVNACLLSTENQNNRLNESLDVDPKSNGAKARKMAVKKAREAAPELVSNALEAGIQADYVLFDSWFSSPKVIRAMKEKDLDVVARVKKSCKIHDRFQGKLLSCKDIFHQCSHRRGRSRYLLSVLVEICGGDKQANPVAAKLVFVRNRRNRADYIVLLSTNIVLTEDEIIQLYGKRWDIEVIFKTCKSVLKLTKECRSLSYDAMCAQAALVFMRYMFLKARVFSDLLLIMSNVLKPLLSGRPLVRIQFGVPQRASILLDVQAEGPTKLTLLFLPADPVTPLAKPPFDKGLILCCWPDGFCKNS